MPVDWSLYPSNWKEIATRIKEDAGWVCQECGKQCRKPGIGGQSRFEIIAGYCLVCGRKLEARQ